jgi:single-stranded-DNA-specific exonuclease
MDKIPQGTELLIIVDSSSSETESCYKLHSQGISTVVLDHHPIEKDNPYCILVNPQQEGDKSPNKELCGSSLVWKVCAVLDDILKVNLADNYIDLAACGIIADMMDMRNPENRYITYEGLENIRNEGLLAILKLKNKKPVNLSTIDIGYNVAPFINAAARMLQLELALDLLTNGDQATCNTLAKGIEKLNNQRKGIQSNYSEEYDESIDLSHNIIILIKEDVSKSFGGLIANQIAQKYQRPCLILTKRDEVFSGSYRSYGEFNLKEYFKSIETVFDIGGHDQAGGVTVRADDIEQFLNEARIGLNSADFEQVIEYDIEVNSKEINEEYIRRVNEFFRINGKNLKEGKFLVRNLFVADKPEMLGKVKKETVKIDCDHIQLMKFKTNEEYVKQFNVFSTLDVVGTLNINVYYNFGKKELVKTKQIFMDDFRISKE